VGGTEILLAKRVLLCIGPFLDLVVLLIVIGCNSHSQQPGVRQRITAVDCFSFSHFECRVLALLLIQ